MVATEVEAAHAHKPMEAMVSRSTSEIGAAKQRLALAKQWEASIVDTLEIAWKQVEEATRHLQSARDQVKAAESHVRAAEKHGSLDNDGKTSSSTGRRAASQGSGKKGGWGRIGSLGWSMVKKGDAKKRDDDEMSTGSSDDEDDGNTQTIVWKGRKDRMPVKRSVTVSKLKRGAARDNPALDSEDEVMTAPVRVQASNKTPAKDNNQELEKMEKKLERELRRMEREMDKKDKQFERELERKLERELGKKDKQFERELERKLEKELGKVEKKEKKNKAMKDKKNKELEKKVQRLEKKLEKSIEKDETTKRTRRKRKTPLSRSALSKSANSASLSTNDPELVALRKSRSKSINFGRMPNSKRNILEKDDQEDNRSQKSRSSLERENKENRKRPPRKRRGDRSVQLSSSLKLSRSEDEDVPFQRHHTDGGSSDRLERLVSQAKLQTGDTSERAPSAVRRRSSTSSTRTSASLPVAKSLSLPRHDSRRGSLPTLGQLSLASTRRTSLDVDYLHAENDDNAASFEDLVSSDEALAPPTEHRAGPGVVTDLSELDGSSIQRQNSKKHSDSRSLVTDLSELNESGTRRLFNETMKVSGKPSIRGKRKVKDPLLVKSVVSHETDVTSSSKVTQKRSGKSPGAALMLKDISGLDAIIVPEASF
mmetsp:Transcript_12266/g.26106  ORF Transcript_12266/g.26106 Transcript_12266/m.26106 type:complete len:654 (-) Transcript_12266:198-2159(-)